jgi:hypothetical protein
VKPSKSGLDAEDERRTRKGCMERKRVKELKKGQSKE